MSAQEETSLRRWTADPSTLEARSARLCLDLWAAPLLPLAGGISGPLTVSIVVRASVDGDNSLVSGTDMERSGRCAGRDEDLVLDLEAPVAHEHGQGGSHFIPDLPPLVLG